eukprot:CAMPEP_0170072462 /NCGR_PEP_ID=MMETSP0019_2-20121128/10102_1 /TAXON_ID=98059 /ORGANISM="Dinobryon sp., Strain UTEXLB2267" /LENGTH=68 /DNA_ID=CAMNT_0010281461 /DNA_START=651 /DNA_END=858 /DNA_ORIENTATION=-
MDFMRTTLGEMRAEVDLYGVKMDITIDDNPSAAEFFFDSLSLSAPGLTTVTVGEAASVTVNYSTPDLF